MAAAADESAELLPPLARSLSAKRAAYRAREPGGLLPGERAARARRAPCCSLAAFEGSAYVKPLVYGGLDGTITTFAAVSAAVGADLDWRVALVMGVANLLADGLSMALGDYFSSRAAEELAEHEARVEAWALAAQPAAERAQLERALRAHGLSEADARTVAEVAARNPPFFCELMLAHEQGIVPPQRGAAAPRRAAWCDSAVRGAAVTFVAFELCGAAPVATYSALQAAAQAAGLDAAALRGAHFGACVCATALTTFALGVCKAAVTGGARVEGGLRMDLNVALAGGASYAVAWAVRAAVEALGLAAPPAHAVVA